MMRILFSAIAIVAMVGCSKTESVEIDNWSDELRITSGIESRASETIWENNDKIGVFMSSTGTTTAVGLHNSKYTTSSESSTAEFTPDTDVTPLYYPQSGNVDIVAHYPYNASSSVESYPVNVADQTDLTLIDFMSTKVIGAAKSSSALNLTFSHLLTQVKVVLSPGEGMTATELETATVKISGTKALATATLGYDTTTSKATASYDIDNATAVADLSVTAANSTATLIVVPQSATVTFTITVANLGDLVTPATALTFESGYEQTYTITVNRTAAKIDGTYIASWGSTGNASDGTFDARL